MSAHKFDRFRVRPYDPGVPDFDVYARSIGCGSDGGTVSEAELAVGDRPEAALRPLADRPPCNGAAPKSIGAAANERPRRSCGGCPYGATDADECHVMRERAVAGISDDIPPCPVHGGEVDRCDGCGQEYVNGECNSYREEQS